MSIPINRITVMRKQKRVRSKYGESEMDIPQDRNSSFEPKILPKHK